MTKKQSERLESLIPDGIPRYVRCYDSPENGDRYTVVFSGRYNGTWQINHRRSYVYLGMSERPFHPQGIGQHGSTSYGPVDTQGATGRPYEQWPPAMGRKCHLGKRIPFTDLPEDCRKLVMSTYRDLWNLNTSVEE